MDGRSIRETAAQPAQAGDGLLVWQGRQPFQLRVPFGADPGQLDHGTALLPTEAQLRNASGSNRAKSSGRGNAWAGPSSPATTGP